MNRNQRLFQRIFIFIPVLLIFYSYIFKTKLPLAYLLAFIQFTTHIYLLITGKQCIPKTKNLCNIFAMVIGILFMGITIKYKLGVIPLLISLYMIISHIVTIYPLKGTFEYKQIQFPIFDTSSYIFILSDMFHEKQLSKDIDELLKHTDGCIIDAGAYIGDSFVLKAKNYPERTFYMIEPSNYNANFIEKIKSPNVKVLRYLLSDTKKVYESKNTNYANASYQENELGDVESITVDELISEKVGIMHYDVEGMELEVVKGSIGLITRYRPVIIVESLGKDICKTKQIIRLLEELNYNYYIVNENCSAFDLFDTAKCRNYVFLPQLF